MATLPLIEPPQQRTRRSGGRADPIGAGDDVRDVASRSAGGRGGDGSPGPERLPMRRRLSYKQARNTVLLTLVLGLLVATGQIIVDLMHLERRTDVLVNQVMRTVHEPAAEAAYGFDRDMAGRVLDGLFAYEPIVLAELRNDFGSVLALRERPAESGTRAWLAEHLLPRELEYALPLTVVRNALDVGVLRVRLDRTLIAAEFFERASVTLWAGLLWTVGLATILVVSLHVAVTKPFLRVSQQLARIDPARPSETLVTIPPRHDDDELGILGRSINGLLLRLGQSLERHRRAEDRVRERELRLRGIMENVADGIVTIDTCHRVETMNRAALELFGYRADEAAGLPFDRCLADGDLPHVLRALARSLHAPDERSDVVRQELTARRKSGETVPISFSVSQMRLGDRVSFICVVRDITERRDAERALMESEQRLKLAVTATRSGVWDADLRTGRVWWSPEFVAMLGYAPDELPMDRGETWEVLIHPDDRSWTAALAERYLSGEITEYAPVYRMRRKDGSWVWIEARGQCLRDGDGVAHRFTGTMTDVTERKRFEEQLMYMATHDPLTGLPNRTLLQDRLTHAMGLSRRKGTGLAALSIDLDRFKLVNDSLGHEVGDRLLKAVAQAIAGAVRSTDTVGRLGVDEFLVIAEDLAEPKDAGRIGMSVLEALAKPLEVGGHSLFATASVGISTFDGRDEDDATDVAALLRHADTAMHSAKSGGGNTLRYYRPEMNEEVAARLALERSLRDAIERNQFELVYQPKVDVATLRLLGLEALIRWKHPEKGYIPPTIFIPVAEETGLIGAIGDWVLRTALDQIARWRARQIAPLPVAVNISVRQLTDESALRTVRSLLSETGIDPGLLELEVTETTMMDNIDSIAETLHALRDLGVGVAVDDFGTGHSSLAYLRRLPITALKVDRSFIDDVIANPDDAAIAATIIAMGRQLGLKVVAEGIETAEQLAFLRRHACDEAQGYHIARPLPAEELETRFLDGGRWREAHSA
ncbi:EAL domain-containing protein [Azospirillum halopraeferens]|uniref:EAL domain-containing protein n=1 Tax=Azospirillum halopraeferens TaxID=34010 RepID=UPI00041F1274|nr:EAL domain-containing protein [Azospirillum halopraeferens]